jgi:hypothetical protein
MGGDYTNGQYVGCIAFNYGNVWSYFLPSSHRLIHHLVDFLCEMFIRLNILVPTYQFSV